MSDLRFTLLADGSSDRVLIPLLTRLIEETRPDIAAQGDFADFGYFRFPPRDLADRIRAAIEYFPCDLLFVHRDAEREHHDVRSTEIQNALAMVRRQGQLPVPTVCIVPVRMQEAWLLVDEAAIRIAAGNPDGRMPLNLPAPNRIEDIPDPKEVLFAALRIASGKRGRRLKGLPVGTLRHRVADLMEDITGLRTIPAFAALEEALALTLADCKSFQRHP
jgi:hypothetical protein